MSEIKNGGLDQYGTEPFEQQQFGTSGVEGVKHCRESIRISDQIVPMTSAYTFASLNPLFKTGAPRCLSVTLTACLLAALSLQASQQSTSVSSGVSSCTIREISPPVVRGGMRVGNGNSYNRACAACDFGLALHLRPVWAPGL